MWSLGSFAKALSSAVAPRRLPELASDAPHPRSMIEPIQYLRGLAAVLVLLDHLAFKLGRYPVSPLRWLHAANIGVDLFFVISGFVITHSTRDKHGSLGSVDDFLRGRIARIFPLYWFMTIVANIAFVVAPSLVNTASGKTDVLASYFLLPTVDNYLIHNGWTLSYEFYFYALFALGLLLPRASGRGLVIAILCLMGSSRIVLTPRGPLQQLLSDPLILEFAAGMLLYLLYDRAIALGRSVRLAIAGLAVALWIFVNAGHSTGIRALDYGVIASLVCLAAVTRRRDVPPLHWEVSRWLGDISYSLYLSHPFIVAGAMLVLSQALSPLQDRPYLQMILTLTASLAAAAAVHYSLERPLTRAARHLLRRHRVRAMPTPTRIE
jgi:peptidoglycan/LPS O-acetylase OafA/YrhL